MGKAKVIFIVAMVMVYVVSLLLSRAGETNEGGELQTGSVCK